MADVSGAPESGQSGERAAPVEWRLLARLLGAVLLVLVGGLLLLDRAFLRANRNQAALDARSAALLTEAFLAARTDLLEQIASALAARRRAFDSSSVVGAVLHPHASRDGLLYVWVSDSATGSPLALPEGEARLPPAVLARALATASRDRPTISVVPLADPHALLVFAHPLARTGPDGVRRIVGTVGLLVDGRALERWLARTQPDTRLALAVLVGRDSVLSLGRRQEGSSPATAHALVHLPTGGTWQVATRHSLATRQLRVSLWALGTLGVLLLAGGLYREQQRAHQMGERSAELERLYSDVKRANQAKSEFLANISHELRTPLNAIVGFVELLRDGFYGDLSPRQVPPVDRIAASATHLRHLVDQVLDIAKIAAGRLEVQAETIVLRPFVLNVASELESLVSEKGLSLSITVGASLPRVRTDPTHLRQILINLIGNAVKYTPAGSVSVRARLVGAPPTGGAARPVPHREEASVPSPRSRVPRSGVWVALQVVDTGVGIAESDQERVFDEFEQVNAGPRGDSMQRGTGLGLPISRRLARLLGGDISVESELGRGSTFTVWLPVNPLDLHRDRVEAQEAGLAAP